MTREKSTPPSFGLFGHTPDIPITGLPHLFRKNFVLRQMIRNVFDCSFTFRRLQVLFLFVLGAKGKLLSESLSTLPLNPTSVFSRFCTSAFRPPNTVNRYPALNGLLQ